MIKISKVKFFIKKNPTVGLFHDHAINTIILSIRTGKLKKS